MKKQLLLFTLLFSFFANAQNVGIGNASPNEKLDVTGNINVTGTIKTNGVDGTANQVLMKNSVGNLTRGDITEFKNHVTFTAVGSSSWTVPAGVTRIQVEAWGGGGGPSANGGGGGGGYVTAIFTVSTGSVSYTVGTAGVGGVPAGTSGGNSSVTFSTQSVTAFGGSGDNGTVTFAVAPGGSFSGSSGTGFYGAPGEAGNPNSYGGYQLSATVFKETLKGGKGGDGGNSINTGGKGASGVRDPGTFSVSYMSFGGDGRMPGGGGGCWGTWGGSINNAGQGMVIIHY